MAEAKSKPRPPWSETLSLAERLRLRRLEKLIQSVKAREEPGDLVNVFMRAFYEVRDRRLYRQHHRTFQDYCVERWGMAPAWAHAMALCAAETNLRPLQVLRDAPREVALRGIGCTVSAEPEKFVCTISTVGPSPRVHAARKLWFSFTI